MPVTAASGGAMVTSTGGCSMRSRNRLRRVRLTPAIARKLLIAVSVPASVEGAAGQGMPLEPARRPARRLSRWRGRGSRADLDPSDPHFDAGLDRTVPALEDLEGRLPRGRDRRERE